MKKKKVVSKLRQKVKVKVDIVTSDDIKIYYTGKFQDFTARYMINFVIAENEMSYVLSYGWWGCSGSSVMIYAKQDITEKWIHKNPFCLKKTNCFLS